MILSNCRNQHFAMILYESKKARMTIWILSHEPALRLGSFTAIFTLMAFWEIFAQRRELSQGRSKRWFANLGISVISSFSVRLLFPAAAVGSLFSPRPRVGASSTGSKYLSPSP